MQSGWRKSRGAFGAKLRPMKCKIAGSSKAGRFVSASVPKGEARRNSVSTTTEFKTKQNLNGMGPRPFASRKRRVRVRSAMSGLRPNGPKNQDCRYEETSRRYREENGEREARHARTIFDVRNQKGERNCPAVRSQPLSRTPEKVS
jgi:hypothetical protein